MEFSLQNFTVMSMALLKSLGGVSLGQAWVVFFYFYFKKSLGVVQGRLIAIVNKMHHMSMETLRRQIHFTTY
jgi:hypothetical protein